MKQTIQITLDVEPVVTKRGKDAYRVTAHIDEKPIGAAESEVLRVAYASVLDDIKTVLRYYYAYSHYYLRSEENAPHNTDISYGI